MIYGTGSRGKRGADARYFNGVDCIGRGKKAVELHVEIQASSVDKHGRIWDALTDDQPFDGPIWHVARIQATGIFASSEDES